MQVCRGRIKITKVSQFLTLDTHFMREGCCGRIEAAIYLALISRVLRRIISNRNIPSDDPHFAREDCCGPLEIAMLPQFFDTSPPSVREGRRNIKIAIFSQFYL